MSEPLHRHTHTCVSIYRHTNTIRRLPEGLDEGSDVGRLVGLEDGIVVGEELGRDVGKNRTNATLTMY